MYLVFLAKFLAKDQRAANGGSDPSWYKLAFFGAPQFSAQRSPNTYF